MDKAAPPQPANEPARIAYLRKARLLDTPFCAYTIELGTPMQVSDAVADARFQDNPLVVDAPYIRFYAGAPMVRAILEAAS